MQEHLKINFLVLGFHIIFYGKNQSFVQKLNIQRKIKMADENKISEVRHYVLTYSFDSNPNTGAVNRNALGSEFSVDLETPLIVPKEAENINVKVKNANVWFVTPNITLGINSKFSLTYNAINYTIDVPTGLYDVDTLSARIQTQLNIASAGVTPVDIIQLLPDIALNSVVIQINYYNVDIDFRDNTVPNNIRGILGFGSVLINGPVAGVLPTYFEGAETARFNNTDYYLIKSSSLVTRGLSINSTYDGILARIDINVSVNSKIVYDPRQVPEIPAPELRGIDLSTLSFQLTNQLNELVDTRGENYNITFEIHYDLPVQNIIERA